MGAVVELTDEEWGLVDTPRCRASRRSSPTVATRASPRSPASHNLALDIKRPPPAPVLPPAKPGGKPRKGKRTFTPLRPLYKVENAFARLGMWRRLSRCYEQTALGAQTWMEVACVAYLCGRLRVEPT